MSGAAGNFGQFLLFYRMIFLKCWMTGYVDLTGIKLLGGVKNRVVVFNFKS
jgi:hypothetical protein